MALEIKLARELQGMKQIDLAVVSGIPNYRLSLLETGRKDPTPAELFKLKKLLPALSKVKKLLDD